MNFNRAGNDLIAAVGALQSEPTDRVESLLAIVNRHVRLDTDRELAILLLGRVQGIGMMLRDLDTRPSTPR